MYCASADVKGDGSDDVLKALEAVVNGKLCVRAYICVRARACVCMCVCVHVCVYLCMSAR